MVVKSFININQTHYEKQYIKIYFQMHWEIEEKYQTKNSLCSFYFLGVWNIKLFLHNWKIDLRIFKKYFSKLGYLSPPDY